MKHADKFSPAAFPQNWGWDAIRIVLIALLYFAAHRVAFLFPDAEQILAAVWPAGGIGLAALLLNRRRLWLPILAALFIAGNAANLLAGRPIFNSLGFMTANVLESLLCAWVIIYFCGENVTFTRVKEMLALVFAVTVVNACTALIGAGTAWFASLTPFWSFWATWWVADGLGMLIVAPLIVAWMKPRDLSLRPQWVRILETGIFLTLWSLIVWFAFQNKPAHNPFTPQPYFLVLLLTYAALRLNLRGTTSAITIMSVMLISSGAVNTGPLSWGGDTLRDRVLLAQMFIASITVTGYLLSTTLVERRQAENALRDSESALKQAQRVAHVGNWAWHIKENHLEWSDEMYRIFGYEKETFSGRLDEVMAEAIHPDDRAEVERSNLSVMKDKKPIPLEYRVIHPDKTVRTVWAEAGQLKLDDQGNPIILTGIVQDITERKQAEAALLQANERLSMAQRAAGAGIWDWDMATGTLNWTPEFFQLFGLDPVKQDATFDTWRSAVHPDDVQLAEQRVSASIRDHAPLYNEYRVVLPSGETCWIGAWGDTTYTEQGEPQRMTGICIDITARKQAELQKEAALAALHENEQNLRILFETMTEGIALNEIIYDENSEMIDYRILNVNPAFYKTSNYEGKTVIGNTATNLYGMTPEFIKEFWKQHQKKNSIAYAEMPSPISNRWFFVATSPFIDNRFVTSFFDITERKQTEDALQKSEASFRVIFEKTSTGYVLTSPDGHLLKVNAALANMLGYSIEELEQSNFQNITHPDDQVVSAESIRSLLAGEQDTHQFEKRYLHRNGSIVWAFVNTTLLRDHQGAPLYFITSITDITARRKMEEALRESQKRYQLVFENSGTANAIFDTQCRLVLQNSLSLEQLGVKLGEALGKTALEILGAERGAVITERMQHALDSGVTQSFEAEFNLPAGKKWFRSTHQPIFDEQKKMVGVQVISQDITERKLAEEEIRQLNASLEQRVEERTRELREAQDQLVQQEKLAVLGQIAGSVGHELLNPMGVISNAVYFLKMAQPDANEKIKEYLNLIEKHIHISDTIVSDLLDFTRTKAVECTSISIPQAIQQTLEHFPMPKNIQVKLDLPDDLPQAYADLRQTVQILGNLTLNACEAMATQGGELAISSRVQNDIIHVAIRDTGVGISPEDMKKLFEPLFTTKLKGIGLGLAVSKKLAEANGGRIEVESAAGKGSIFTLSLPMYKTSL